VWWIPWGAWRVCGGAVLRRVRACVRAGAVLGLALVWWRCGCAMCAVWCSSCISLVYTCFAGPLRAPFCAARCAHGLFNENIPPKGNLVNIPEPSVG